MTNTDHATLSALHASALGRAADRQSYAKNPNRKILGHLSISMPIRLAASRRRGEGTNILPRRPATDSDLPLFGKKRAAADWRSAHVGLSKPIAPPRAADLRLAPISPSRDRHPFSNGPENPHARLVGIRRAEVALHRPLARRPRRRRLGRSREQDGVLFWRLRRHHLEDDRSWKAIKGDLAANDEEAAAVARRRGAKVWLAYTAWLVGGPSGQLFADLVSTTGANSAPEGAAPERVTLGGKRSAFARQKLWRARRPTWTQWLPRGNMLDRAARQFTR